MYKLTFIRFLLILIIGVLLYMTLLYLSGRVELGHLKKRNKSHKRNRDNSYIKVICIYFLTLLTGLLILFVIIKYVTRGAD
jgi:uncharacterized membrane protein